MNTNSLDSIDSNIEDNTAHLSNMELFIESKQLELFELQKYLIEEFQSIEDWQQKKQKLSGLVKDQLKNLLLSLKLLVLDLKGKFQETCGQILQQTTQAFTSVVARKNEEIQQNLKIIEELKGDLAQHKKKSVKHFGNKTFENKSSLLFSKNRAITMSSTFLQYHLQKSKSKERIASKSPEFNQSSNLRQSSMKKIMKEVQRNLKQDYQNSRTVIDHKKHVKEKIENLKNKQAESAKHRKAFN